MLPSFNAMLVMPNKGWYVLYANGDVYWCSYTQGTEKCPPGEAQAIRTLYEVAPEKFQTDNKRRGAVC